MRILKQTILLKWDEKRDIISMLSQTRVLLALVFLETLAEKYIKYSFGLP